MRTLGILPAVAALALGISSCQGGAQALSDEELAAVRGLHDQLVQALLANDWDAAAAVWAENAVIMAPNLPVVQGRAAWRAWVDTVGVNVTDATYDLAETDGRDGLAYLRGAYSETFTVTGVPEPITDTGKYLAIARKQPDGSWLFTVWAWNSDLPLPE